MMTARRSSESTEGILAALPNHTVLVKRFVKMLQWIQSQEYYSILKNCSSVSSACRNMLWQQGCLVTIKICMLHTLKYFGQLLHQTANMRLNQSAQQVRTESHAMSVNLNLSHLAPSSFRFLKKKKQLTLLLHGIWMLWMFRPGFVWRAETSMNPRPQTGTRPTWNPKAMNPRTSRLVATDATSPVSQGPPADVWSSTERYFQRLCQCSIVRPVCLSLKGTCGILWVDEYHQPNSLTSIIIPTWLVLMAIWCCCVWQRLSPVMGMGKTCSTANEQASCNSVATGQGTTIRRWKQQAVLPHVVWFPLQVGVYN